MHINISNKLLLLISLSAVIIPISNSTNAEILTKRQQLVVPTQDFNQAEKFEHYPGGTVGKFIKQGRKSLSQPSAGLSADDAMDFNIGRSMFKKLWAPAPAATQASNGLGPLFNARSCLSCHIGNGRGHAPDVGFPNEDANSMLIRLSIKPQNKADEALLKSGKVTSINEPTYGGQLQDIGITGFAPEGKISVNWAYSLVELQDGQKVELRKPEFSINNLAYGPMHKDMMLSPRIATQMVGMGLIDTIDALDIMANADPDDLDGDGISGKANMVWDEDQQETMLGRFGWKAGQPNLHQQVAAAFSGDIGINSPLFKAPSGDCTVNQQTCLGAPNGNTDIMGKLELSEELLRLTSFFNANLAVPHRKSANQENILLGKQAFYQSGCISCHKPKFVTGETSPYSNLYNELIWPYSDFLLHDMGSGLADNHPEGKATGTEWRTAPLWALGDSKYLGKSWQLLHDGRARNIEEAILWHDGEALNAKENYKSLNKIERKALVEFVKSL